MRSAIYLTRNGLLEPLGQSQVLAYLRGLSRDYRITLITYEKETDRSDNPRMSAMRAECDGLGIRWLPQRFRPSPKVIAPALSMLRMVWLLYRETKGQGARLIHARSYIPAAVALIVSRMTDTPFIFDMRALWPEELITAGRLTRGSLLHRAIVTAERACLARAGAVVSLTHAAVDHLKRIYPEALAGQSIAVIPTCADLDRFVPSGARGATRMIGCLGTVLSGWFKLDWLAAFLKVAATRDPDARFELTTLDDAAAVRAALDPEGRLGERLTIASSAPAAVHTVLQRQTASVMFFTDGLSKLGSSPTRMAEILGCGMPVVANDGVGDVAEIIRKHRVGVLATSSAPEAMETAWSALLALLDEPDIAARCRAAAQEVFSLQAGTTAYAAIYRSLAGGERQCAA